MMQALLMVRHRLHASGAVTSESQRTFDCRHRAHAFAFIVSDFLCSQSIWQFEKGTANSQSCRAHSCSLISRGLRPRNVNKHRPCSVSDTAHRNKDPESNHICRQLTYLSIFVTPQSTVVALRMYSSVEPRLPPLPRLSHCVGAYHSSFLCNTGSWTPVILRGTHVKVVFTRVIQ